MFAFSHTFWGTGPGWDEFPLVKEVLKHEAEDDGKHPATKHAVLIIVVQELFGSKSTSFLNTLPKCIYVPRTCVVLRMNE